MKIAVLLDGPIKNDGRVRKMINTLSAFHTVVFYYCDGTLEDANIFDTSVKIYSFKKKEGFIWVNILFQKRFDSLKLALIANEKEVDIIYCNDYPLLETAVDIKKYYPESKLIYDSHEIYIETINQFFPISGWKSIYGKPFIYINKLYHSKREKDLVKSVDSIITVCDSLKFYFEKLFNFHSISVIKNCPNEGIEVVKQNLIREKLGLREDDFILLYQGWLNRGRGLENLVDASTFFNDKIHLVILGDGSIKGELITQAQSLGFKNIHFLGTVSQEDLLNYSCSADLGVSLIEPINKSKEYALPNKVFEYMTAGLPILVHNTPECISIIEDCKCGFIVEQGNPKSLGELISKLSCDRKLLAEVGERGKKFYKEKYSWENEVAKVNDVIQEMK